MLPDTDTDGKALLDGVTTLDGIALLDGNQGPVSKSLPVEE